MDDNSSACNGGRFFCAFTGVKEVNLPATSCLKKINEKVNLTIDLTIIFNSIMKECNNLSYNHHRNRPDMSIKTMKPIKNLIKQSLGNFLYIFNFFLVFIQTYIQCRSI